jgi:hypothetical protein
MDEMVVRVGHHPKLREKPLTRGAGSRLGTTGLTPSSSPRWINDLVIAWEEAAELRILNARTTAVRPAAGEAVRGQDLPGVGPLTPVTASDAVHRRFCATGSSTCTPSTRRRRPGRSPWTLDGIRRSCSPARSSSTVPPSSWTIWARSPTHCRRTPRSARSGCRPRTGSPAAAAGGHHHARGMDGGTSFGAKHAGPRRASTRHTWMGYVYSNPADPGERPSQSAPRHHIRFWAAWSTRWCTEVGHFFQPGDEYEEGAGRSGFAAETGWISGGTTSPGSRCSSCPGSPSASRATAAAWIRAG